MAEKLFAYGTLKDPVIQAALFGRRLNGYAAHIKNWGLFMAQEGYLFVKPCAGGRVDGLILELESEDLDKADAWEDLTVYSREVSCAISKNKTESVYIYTRRSADGSPHQDDSLHGRTISEILHDIEHLSMYGNDFYCTRSIHNPHLETIIFL